MTDSKWPTAAIGAGTVLALLCSAGLLAAQEARGGTDSGPTGGGRPALLEGHRPELRLPPLEVFDHIKAGHLRVVQTARTAAQLRAMAPLQRPAGAGDVLAAVFVCSDARLDTAAVLGLASVDLLVFSTPGPVVTTEQVASLERAVANGTSLALILVHDQCDTLRLDGTDGSPSARALATRIAPARALAARTRRPLAESLALLQVQNLLRASPELARHHEEGGFAVVIGRIEQGTRRIRWQQELVVPRPLVGTRAGAVALERRDREVPSPALDVPRDQPTERKRHQGNEQHAGGHQR